MSLSPLQNLAQGEMDIKVFIKAILMRDSNNQERLETSI